MKCILNPTLYYKPREDGLKQKVLPGLAKWIPVKS